MNKWFPEIKKNFGFGCMRLPMNGTEVDPNWWGTCPMAVFSQLERLDLEGKVIAPFCTNEGSGMGSSESDLREICKGAKFAKGLSIHGAEAAQSEAEAAA